MKKLKRILVGLLIVSIGLAWACFVSFYLVAILDVLIKAQGG